MATLSRIAAAIFIALFAGLVSAGEQAAGRQVATAASDSEAWIGEYRVRDAQGERMMPIVRDATRIEYRERNMPVRVWRQMSDGIELQEIDPQRGEIITYAPGDLRARALEPVWRRLASVVDPALRDRLTAGRNGKAFGESLQRYRGRDAANRSIELDWLIASEMPARYRVVAEGVNETIELRGMRRLPTAQAFTPIDGLRERDAADLGD